MWSSLGLGFSIFQVQSLDRDRPALPKQLRNLSGPPGLEDFGRVSQEEGVLLPTASASTPLK